MDIESLEFVRLARTEAGAELTLSRPKALNALNQQVLRELDLVLEELRHGDLPATLIITGDGDRAFVAGADIAEMAKMGSAEADELARLGHRVMDALEDFPAPTLAAVNGFALGGGCELALACDIIYASERAKFGQPEVKLGLIPGFGGTVRLPRKVGLAVASEWILTGEVYSAQVAKEVGLVREVVPPEQLMPRVREVAALIAKRGPLATRAAKRMLVRGLATLPDTAAAMERWSFARLFDTADMREGTQAFVEKREPTFKGR